MTTQLQFKDLIGLEVFVALWGFNTQADAEKNPGAPGSSLAAKLIGAEPGGIWVESDELNRAFAELVWSAELEEGGPDAVGKTSLARFLPFSMLRFVLVRVPSSPG